MEEEAEKLRQMQEEVEKEMNLTPTENGESKEDIDTRSVYIGNVMTLDCLLLIGRWITLPLQRKFKHIFNHVVLLTESLFYVINGLVIPKGKLYEIISYDLNLDLHMLNLKIHL